MRKREIYARVKELEAELDRRVFQVNALKVEHEKLLNDYRICYAALGASQKKVRELTDKLKTAEDESERLRDTDVKICEENERLRREAVSVSAEVDGGSVDGIIPSPADTSVSDPEPAEAVTPAAADVPVTAAPQVDMTAIERTGADAIGDVVLRVSGLMGSLASSSDPNVHDALTLLLGRTEIFKSEILTVVNDRGADDAAKADRIAGLRAKAFEYFDSVMGQIDNAN